MWELGFSGISAPGGGELTHVRQGFDARLDVALGGRLDPGAVVEPEG